MVVMSVCRSFLSLLSLFWLYAALCTSATGNCLSIPANCYSSVSCAVKSRLPSLQTIEECCLSEQSRSFHIPGLEGCIPCIVYGWSQPQFVGVARKKPYSVEIQIMKGYSGLRDRHMLYDVVLAQGGNATEGKDFTFQKETAISFQEASHFPLKVSFEFLLNCVAGEPPKTFALELRHRGGLAPPSIAFVLDRIEMTIIDGDVSSCVNLTLENTDITVKESESVTICVVPSHTQFSRHIPVKINYRPGKAPAAASNNDYYTTTTQLTISADNLSSGCFNFTPIMDGIYEEDEELFIIIRTTDKNAFINEAMARVTIVDVDIFSVGFTNPIIRVVEGMRDLSLCLAKSTTVEQVFVSITTRDGSAKKDIDFYPDGLELTIVLEPGTTETCFTAAKVIAVHNSSAMEGMKSFFLTISDVRTVPADQTGPTRISLGIDEIEVFIGNNESSTCLLSTNKTFSGHPILIVPIIVPSKQLKEVQLSRLSLCYEVHGQENTWFNFVSDQCTSINAHYYAATDEINAIDEIAIRTVTNSGACKNISIHAAYGRCQVSVDGEGWEDFNHDGIKIRRYSNRVRVSLPNCNRVALVMWVECERRGGWESGSGGGSSGSAESGDDVLMNESVKFVVVRGLNHGHKKAHGLLGQLWNLPVNIAKYEGVNDTSEHQVPENLFAITIASASRSSVHTLGHLVWTQEGTPCLYVGGGIQESSSCFIEGLYFEYIVSGPFSDDFYFRIFDSISCQS